LFFDFTAGAESFAAGGACTVTNFGFTNRTLTVGNTSPQQVVAGWETCGASCTLPGTDVEFCVDLSCLPQAPNMPSVFGNFTTPPFDVNQNLLTSNGAGLYCTTVNILPGTYEFLFFDQTQGAESFEEGDPCTVTNFGFTNRSLVVGGTSPQLVTFGWNSCDETCDPPPPPVVGTDVEFCVDLSCLPTTPNLPSVFGNFTDPPFDVNSNLLTPNGAGLYCTTVNILPGTYEFLFFDNTQGPESFAEGAPCTVTNFGFTNRTLTVGTTPQQLTFGWQSCDATCVVPTDVEFCVDLQCLPQAPDNPSVFGTFPGAFFDVNQNLLTQNSAGLYCATVSLPPGTYEYLFFDNTEGAESFIGGESCTVTNFGFTNRSLVVGTTSPQMETFVWESCDMSQVINLEITCPADVTVSCDASTAPADTGMATATNQCGEPTITFADVSTQGLGCDAFTFMITRTWMATDNAGNSATCNQIITVEDTTAPVITCPANITGSCTDSTLPADTGMATAVDNCSPLVTITSSDVTSQGADGCGQFNFTIERTWVATDVCGNMSSCVQTISIMDSEAPTITCPANQTLACNTDPLPIATTIDDFIAIGGTVSDNCSELSELTLTVSDSPTNQAMLNFCPGTTDAERTLTRTYTVTDPCGNTSSCDQLFIYSPSMNGPVITAIPLDQTVDCAVNAFPQLDLFEAEGDCSSISFTVSGPSFSGTTGCPGSTIQYTYTATDVCGRSAIHVQTYTLANEGPEFVCPTDICVIECPSDNDMIQAQFDDYANLATVIAGCSEIGISISNNFNPNGFIPQNCMNPTIQVAGAVAFQVVQFTATDACGRNGTCTALVVLRDNNGPIMNSSLSVGTADCNDGNLQQGYTSWANSQLSSLSATDECAGGDVTFSFSPTSANVDCSSGLATTLVSFIATDPCGNETIETTFYRIIDSGSIPMATVSGNLFTEEDEMVALANVEVEGYLNSQMLTNTDGYYHFDLEMAQNYSIAPSRNDDPLNGITTYDLILLGQHILEINLLDSPYKMIAADVNESGHISTLDMIELRKLILHIADEFNSGKSWTFVDAAYVFPEPTNPFATTYPTAYNINNLTSSEVIDFIGVKLGDLNGSASVNALQAGDTRSSDGSLKIKLEDQSIQAGQTYELAFKASDFKEVAGFQFTLDFAADYLELVDYQGSNLASMSTNNFGFTRANDGKVTVSWNENSPTALADDEMIFQFSFTALQDGQLSDLVSINSSLTAKEAYQADLRKDVELDFGKLDLLTNEFKLLQNRPNPFTQETLIGFYLPEQAETTLTIYDVSGRVLMTQEGSFEAGIHQIPFNQSDVGATGVLYYQLSTPLGTDTKKMIILK